jgi:glucose-6-phosphate 1-dehydrogenase
VVNHLMQVVAAGGMEAPAGRVPNRRHYSKDARGKAVLAADPAHYVRGQYDGYLGIDGVAPDSKTETYAALRLDIDNWRWSGVPFFIRTGKCLPATQTEFRLVFKEPPRLGLAVLEDHHPDANQLTITLDPTTGIRFDLQAKRAGEVEPEPIDLRMQFAAQGGEGPTPYEVLLHAALVGNSTRFTRQDGVDETWRVMQPLLDTPGPVHPYAKGSWGPAAADALVADFGGWRAPWVQS